MISIKLCRLLLQGYLVEFNQLYEEFRGKKVGIYAVCAEPQNQVDECMKQLGLHYKVSKLGDAKRSKKRREEGNREKLERCMRICWLLLIQQVVYLMIASCTCM